MVNYCFCPKHRPWRVQRIRQIPAVGAVHLSHKERPKQMSESWFVSAACFQEWANTIEASQVTPVTRLTPAADS
jgi:hypothetical protein